MGERTAPVGPGIGQNYGLADRSAAPLCEGPEATTSQSTERKAAPLSGYPSPRESTPDRSAATGEIHKNIEQARAEMSGTLGEIQERLDAAKIKQKIKSEVEEQVEAIQEKVKAEVKQQFNAAKHAVHDATIGRVENMVHQASDVVSETGWTIRDTIRQNPVPAALVGVGLAWLFLNGRSSSSQRTVRSNGYGRHSVPMYDPYTGRYLGGARPSGGLGYTHEPYGSSSVDHHTHGIAESIHDTQETVGDLARRARTGAEDMVNHAQERIGQVAHQAGDKASQLAHQVQGMAGQFVHQAQDQANRVEHRFEQMLHENPMALGAVAVAMGAAVGLAIPQTQKENELMGKARDQLVDKAGSAAHEAIEKAQRTAHKVTDEAKQIGQNATKTPSSGPSETRRF